MIRSLGFVLVLALAGCSSAPKTDSHLAVTPDPAIATATATTAGHEPAKIAQLSDQREVWDCPKCGMDFDAAGSCTMCNAELVHTRVDYSCAADGKAVERAGQCPRCTVPVVVKKTALTASLEAPAPGGK